MKFQLFIILLSLLSFVISETPLGRIHFFNTAKSNAFLIESQGRFGLVDSSNNYLYSEHEVEKAVFDPDLGEENQGTDNPAESVQRVVDYLTALKVDKLDFIIATHSHNDHIGGIPAIAYYFVDNRTYYYYKEYIPTWEEIGQTWANPAYYRAAKHSMQIKGAQLVDVTDKDISFNLGNFKIQLLSTESRDCYFEGENCLSITQLITIGNNRIFLEADLYNREESKIVGKVGIVDVFQVGHHGGHHSASYEFVKVISPKIAIIPEKEVGSDGKAKIAFMEHHFNTKSYLTKGAGEGIDSCAIIANFYSEGFEMENTGEKIDITQFNGWARWIDYYTYLVNGELQTRWQKLDWSGGFDTFYFSDDGIMLTEWQKLDWEGGKQDTFYFDPFDGYMYHDLCTYIDLEYYCFDENGVLIQE